MKQNTYTTASCQLLWPAAELCFAAGAHTGRT